MGSRRDALAGQRSQGFCGVRCVLVIYSLLHKHRHGTWTHGCVSRRCEPLVRGGSGTTGEAVLELNQEEKSQRKFILCTNNEGQIAEEVCYPRLEKIIKGYIKKNKADENIKGLDGNLQYFQTDLVSVKKLTDISDAKRYELTEKAGWMIALKENTFEENECGEYYQIFESKDKKRKTAIYFREDMKKFSELTKKLQKVKTTLYIFSYGRVDKKSFQHLDNNITIDDIPEPIIEIYKEINLTLKEKIT